MAKAGSAQTTLFFKPMGHRWCKEAEHQIARQCVKDLLEAGYFVSVCDGDEWAIVKSRNGEDIYAALFSGDGDLLCCTDSSGKKIGTVKLLYGGDGWDVIHSYSSELQGALQNTWALVSRLEADCQTS